MATNRIISSLLKLVLHQDSRAYPMSGLAPAGSVHLGAAQRVGATVASSPSEVQRTNLSTRSASEFAGVLSRQIRSAETCALPISHVWRQTDDPIDSEYTKLYTELNENRITAWDMRGEMMDARKTCNAELSHLCQTEGAADKAAMKA
jgi:hypothetical protein